MVWLKIADGLPCLKIAQLSTGRHDIQHNGIQHNDIQHKGVICDTA